MLDKGNAVARVRCMPLLGFAAGIRLIISDYRGPSDFLLLYKLNEDALPLINVRYELSHLYL